jgi:hypothetical protein
VQIVKAVVRIPVRKIPIPTIPAWVGFVALAFALLLSGAASALPARWQEFALYTGVGLAFAALGGIVFGVLTAARPDWQGPRSRHFESVG